MLKHAPHRIRQVGKLFQARRHALDAFGGKQQAIEQTRVDAGFFGSSHVLGVGLQDFVRVRAQRRRHRAHSGLTLRVGRKAQGAGCRLGRAGEVLNIPCNIVDALHGSTPLLV